MLEHLQFIFVSALNNIVDISGVGMKTFIGCRKTPRKIDSNFKEQINIEINPSLYSIVFVVL